MLIASIALSLSYNAAVAITSKLNGYTAKWLSVNAWRRKT
jgi:hypothetical protein